MADIAAFRGLLYNPSRVDIDSVLAPPYDVIDGAGREKLAALSPQNCVQLILPEAENAADGDAKYRHAEALMKEWESAEVLVRDTEPAIYRYHQVFTNRELGDAPVVRRGFIAAVRLHDFSERVILRHERTLKGPKIDRLKLWEQTQTHLSQIFTLYSDPELAIDAQFAEAESQAPTICGTTEDGTQHILWRVNDPEVVANVAEMMADKPLYIADGHHRYETMLAFRDNHLAARARDKVAVDDRSPIRFGMMFLANLNDPGLVVLPTHRMIHNLQNFSADSFFSEVAKYFHRKEISLQEGEDGAQLRRALGESSAATSFAVLVSGQSKVTILSLRDDVVLKDLGIVGAEVTLALDVTLLHSLVLEKILGISRADQEAQTHIKYIKDTGSALQRSREGEGQLCFIMNATPVSQVVAVSDADEVMPQKSTFFYPKIASGMVFNPIKIDETL